MFMPPQRPSEPEPEDQELSEVEKVAAWRMIQLLDWYDISKASALAASSGVDLHRAIELRQHGCSPELAVEILL